MIEIEVICDHDDCPEVMEINGADVLKHAVRNIAAAGWYVSGTAQVCPKHRSLWKGHL